MTAPNLIHLRRELALRGLTPATFIPESSGGRTEEACIRPARLLEDTSLEWHPVETAEAWPDPLGFLDGVQRSQVLAYAGSAPIVVADIAAAVRERRNRRLDTVVEEHRRLVIARAPALQAAGELLDSFFSIALPEDDPPHPVRDLYNAARALDGARGNLEIALGERYRQRSDAWLIVDGSLTESPTWASDLHMVGVSKSHATLPFDGADLDRYLRLPPGNRSSIYLPESRNVAQVHAWALRLWPWEGKDLFHGLVRVEVSPANGIPAIADLISRRLLAERAPISTPDPRWDRLLYGVQSVERYLKVKSY
jgi:hypothetical protein